MRYDFFSWWKYFRYMVCATVAFWGFMTVFVEGERSGGGLLLMIAAIGVFSTIGWESVERYLQNRK
ncbi:MAG: hypothetical protein ABW007_16250 [Chitinophagaceae bacterium]